jgi:hypothetical protein
MRAELPYTAAGSAWRRRATAISDYWAREGLGRAILDALAAAGKDLDALTIDDLAPADQFHGGGKDATLRLACLAGLTPGRPAGFILSSLREPAPIVAAQSGSFC